MQERFIIRLCSSFIWMYFGRYLYAFDLVYSNELQVMLFYIGSALCITIFLEAFHYLMVDYIKYSKKLIRVILLVSSLLLYNNFTFYLLFVLLYIDIVMIKELLQSYELYKKLLEFQKHC